MRNTANPLTLRSKAPNKKDRQAFYTIITKGPSLSVHKCPKLTRSYSVPKKNYRNLPPDLSIKNYDRSLAANEGSPEPEQNQQLLKFDELLTVFQAGKEGLDPARVGFEPPSH